ncbi:hypothetical protein [Stenotrophomonas sp. VV52]|uniref:hypothetical protein n=1 Tax=Stenotrophomonas sp. VV52 TaxID=2066958 RepID=UPI0011AF50F2|nr:hypothetical protein [Stenotrophomonas sp. VV52]
MSTEHDGNVLVDEDLVRAIFTHAASRAIGGSYLNPAFDAMADQAHEAAAAYAVSLARRRGQAQEAWLDIL